MTSFPAWAHFGFRSRTFTGPLLILALIAPLHGEDTDPPVQLPAFGVSASILNLPLRIQYQRTPFGPVVRKVFVGPITSPSIAQRAGLREDMEILEIQGTKVLNLSEAKLAQLLVQPAKDSVVLKVRRSWLGGSMEVRLPVPPDPESS